jgi:hypothetical protein
VNLLQAIPVIKWLAKFITAPVMLKERDKEIKRLRARIRKLEKSIK